jgi:hypothetical protein
MAKKPIKIVIVSPMPDQSFLLKAVPVETEPIIFRAVITQDGTDITGNVKISWRLRLSWPTTENTYQTKLEISGNAVEAKLVTGGILRVRAAVVVDGREYSARIKVNIIGKNPTKEQIGKSFDNDLLKSIAWIESTWRQFDSNGQPLRPKVKVKKGQKIPTMRGLFMISEYWWGRDKRIEHRDHNKVAWQWDYNIATAKEILDLLHDLVVAAYPTESDERKWNRAIKAFHEGESSFGTKLNPDKFWYVEKVRQALQEKAWQKL